MEKSYGQSETTGATPPRSNRTWRKIGLCAVVLGIVALLVVGVVLPIGKGLYRGWTNFSNEHLCDTTFAVNGKVYEGNEAITGSGRVVSIKRDGYTEQYEQTQTNGPVTYTTIIDGVERERVNVPGHNTMPTPVETCTD